MSTESKKMMSVKDALDHCAPIMQGAMDAVYAGDRVDAKFRSVADDICSMALEFDLAYEVWVDVNTMFPHPCNRCETMLDPIDAHAVLKDMVTDGYALNAQGNRRGFETLDGDKGKDQVERNL